LAINIKKSLKLPIYPIKAVQDNQAAGRVKTIYGADTVGQAQFPPEVLPLALCQAAAEAPKI
jgi:hypothetical protein